MPYLVHNPGTPDAKVWELKPGVNQIGREQDNKIVIEDEKSLSRYHAEITVTATGVFLKDCQSRNSTFVNETKIAQSKLQDGDLIRCGNAIFRFWHRIESSTPDPEPAEDDPTNLAIVRRFSPEETRVVMQDLLQSDSALGRSSVLKLRQQNADQRTVDKLKILLEVSKQLSSPTEFDQILDKILDLLFRIMNVDRAVILLANETTQQLEPRAVKSQPGIPVDYQFYSKRITSFVREKGDAILTTDARIDERFNDSDSILQQAIHASMCVPLKPKEVVIGVLYVDNLSMSNVYSQEDLEFLTGLANQAAIAIENAQLYKKMQSEAVMRAQLERFFPQAVSQKIKEEGDLKIIETEVTVLFSDMSGYTEMSSQMEPRQVLEMLNEYFKVMVEEIVFRYEGTLEKYIADALLAVWGAPYSQADDAQRAVRSAIEMQWAMRRLNQQWQRQRNLQVQIHIGLNTGKVAAGNIGSKQLIQYANIGDTMNVASRICSAAQAGEILLSQTTLDKLNDPSLPVEALPPVFVKGKAEPLDLYRLLWQQIQPIHI